MAVACILLVLLVDLHLELCSRRLPPGRHAHAEKCALSMLRLSSFTGNSGHYFYETLVLCRVFHSRHVAPSALDDEEFFVVEGSGGGGVAGSQTPRCDSLHWRCHVIIHSHQVASGNNKPFWLNVACCVENGVLRSDQVD